MDKTTNRLPLVFFNNCLEHLERKSVRNGKLLCESVYIAFDPCTPSMCVIDNGYTFLLTELVWKVARYTSAAPVFFAECDNYIDGGVVANNPTMHALAEIQEYLAKTHG